MGLLLTLWNTLLEACPYLSLGLFCAGIIHVFLPQEKISQMLGGPHPKNIFKAALLGIPLPLCSCSVLPLAIKLRKSGASLGSTSSFLISTPESGVDSISLTYATMGLPLTLFRVSSAFITAIIAGLIQLFFNREDEVSLPKEEKKSCCHKDHPPVAPQGKIKTLFTYGFIDLLDDLSIWLSIGLLASALIDYAFPAQLLQEIDPDASKLFMLFLGIPLYICATASTPIAASLVAKGMSPGTAIIFLLVGPATNISNLAVLTQYFGKRGLFLHIASIAFISLLLGYAADFLSLQNPTLFLSPELSQTPHHHDAPLYQVIITVIFLALLMTSLLKKLKKAFMSR